MRLFRVVIPGAVALLSSHPASICRADQVTPQLEVSFERDVRPILKRHCSACHGAESESGGLRVDSRRSLRIGGDSGPAFVPGEPAASLVMTRVTASDGDAVMPPTDAGPRLAAHEIEILRRWIACGEHRSSDVAPEHRRARRHWSFEPIGRPNVPSVTSSAGLLNGVDAFVQSRLEREGLQPSDEADRYTLIRRLTLDLWGLPPSPVDIERFVSDERPDAYARLLDRLLASPHFGQRWAQKWLDLARYADSDGYERDLPRPHAWRWRNWVIDSFNRDQAFDDFTVDQIAGDLLPSATIETRIATAFHCNALTNREPGSDAEEFRFKATVDRLNTTVATWMGLTVECAQCHAHRFDPISHEEYYRLLAFFNESEDANIEVPPEPGVVADYQRALREHHVALGDARASVTETIESRAAARMAWEQALASEATEETRDITTGLTLHLPLDVRGTEILDVVDDRVAGHWVGNERLVYTKRKHDLALQFDGRGYVDLGRQGDLDRRKPFSIACWLFVVGRRGTVISKAADAADLRGWRLGHEGLNLRFEMIHAPEQAVRVVAADVLSQFAWHHVAITYDGSSSAAGIRFYVDGRLKSHTVLSDTLTGAIQTEDSLRLGAPDELGTFSGIVDEVRLYSRELDAETAGAVARNDELVRIAALPVDQRSSEEATRLANQFHASDPWIRRAVRELHELELRRPVDPVGVANVLGPAPTRTTRLRKRGDFRDEGPVVSPGTPAFLHPLKARADRPDRLDLARWITAPENPLTQRVVVNRVWSGLFGRGLVTTTENFGNEGAPPTHPQLLDWLSNEFRHRGWRRKALIRLLATSRTYRQTSVADPLRRAADPGNALWSRQHRHRLDAEVVRDSYLMAAGLLNDRVGGPSFRPPLPEGLSDIYFENRWVPDTGGSLHRRSLYVHLQRNLILPTLRTFDRPDAIITCSQRRRSVTPLQSLTRLNAPLFVESARALGLRIAAASTASVEDNIRRLMLQTVSRPPSPGEVVELRRLFEDLTSIYAADPAAARLLVGARDDQAVTDAAAWVALVRTVLSLHEVTSRD